MHKIIKFNDKNTELRKDEYRSKKIIQDNMNAEQKKTKNNYEKIFFFRLMKNAIFGKVI